MRHENLTYTGIRDIIKQQLKASYPNIVYQVTRLPHGYKVSIFFIDCIYHSLLSKLELTNFKTIIKKISKHILVAEMEMKHGEDDRGKYKSV